jgi:formylglycine-generating enzyme required for sulfatase activity
MPLVNWYDAVLYCNWLSQQGGRRAGYERTGAQEKIKEFDVEVEYDAWRMSPGGAGYRLPTEAEWEYACRAGTVTQFSYGEEERTLDGYGIFTANAWGSSWPCGSKRCNGWGLFDMHGNVWEWCWDWYGDYGEMERVENPMGPVAALPQDTSRVNRGGGWGFGAADCRPGYRNGNLPSYRYFISGFRVALVPFTSSQEARAEPGAAAFGAGEGGAPAR